MAPVSSSALSKGFHFHPSVRAIFLCQCSGWYLKSSTAHRLCVSDPSAPWRTVKLRNTYFYPDTHFSTRICQRMSLCDLIRQLGIPNKSIRSLAFYMFACVCAKSLQSCPTLCDLIECSPPGSSVYEILWAGRLPSPSPGDLPDTGMESVSLSSPALAGRFFTSSTTWEALFICLPLL